MDEAGALLSVVEYCGDAYGPLDGADAMVIITEWNEFRALDLGRARQLMNKPVMIDLRNIYEASEVQAAGFDYHCVGRGGKTRGTGDAAS